MQISIKLLLKLLCQLGTVFGLAISQQQSSFGATLSSLVEGIGLVSGLSGSHSNGGEAYNCGHQLNEYVSFGQRNLRIDYSCDFEYSLESTSNFLYTDSKAGDPRWRPFYKIFPFKGEPDKKYEVSVDVSSQAGSASASATGFSSAKALSYVANGYTAEIGGDYAYAAAFGIGSSDNSGVQSYNYPNTASTMFSGAQDLQLNLGAHIGGYVETNAPIPGHSSASANFSFTTTAIIRELANTNSGGGAGGCVVLEGTDYCLEESNSGFLQSLSENSFALSSSEPVIIEPLPISALPPLSTLVPWAKTPEPSLMGGLFLVPLFLRLRRKKHE
ncbi:MAG TPA: hypothetical protein IGS31_14390 [Oscillatoriales cyanobacterium M4454_W2019_049]|nr:hypothetical protein [Oscillatoriales cyanobacterium M4454_W2019_049]